jgi:HlyD family secretion protein
MSGIIDSIMAALAAVLPGMDGPDPGSFSGYVEADYAYIAPAAPGRIETIAVSEGDRVFAGQQLFTLEATRETAALRAADAQVRVAEANLANLETGSRVQEIAVVEAEVARAIAQRDLAEGNLRRAEELYERRNIAEAQVDEARATLASADAQVAELKARLAVAELPARDAQRIAAEASLDAARAQAAEARSALDDRVVLSPVGGTVEDVYFVPGETAGAGTPVLSILPDGPMKVLFFVPEPLRATMALGEAVGVTCDGCRNGIAGTVTRLGSSPQYTPPIIYSRDERSRLVFRAEARIGTDSGLLPGQPVTVSPLP